MNGIPRTPNTSIHAHTSSIDQGHADIRSPRSKTTDYEEDEHEDRVEMSLLGNDREQERLVPEEEEEEKRTQRPLSRKDKNAMALLIVLCASVYKLCKLYR